TAKAIFKDLVKTGLNLEDAKSAIRSSRLPARQRFDPMFVESTARRYNIAEPPQPVVELALKVPEKPPLPPPIESKPAEEAPLTRTGESLALKPPSPAAGLDPELAH